MTTLKNDNYQLKEDEYLGENGEVYCKKCKTARSITIDGKQYFNLLCKCEQEELEKEEEKQILEKEKTKIIKAFKEKSLLGKRYENASFENIIITNDKQKNAIKRCYDYCQSDHIALSKGYGIYIYGACGVGKTHLIACMVNELINKMHSVIITNLSEISKKIRTIYNTRGNEEEFLKELTTVEFLFIDDFGTEMVQKGGEDNFLQEKIFDIVNSRYNNLLPTIYTSNYSLQELITARGIAEKTIDRVAETSKAILKLEGVNFRKKENEK